MNVAMSKVVHQLVPPVRSIAWLNMIAKGTMNQTADPLAGGRGGVREDSSSMAMPSLLTGGYMGEGLLPIPDKLVKTIINLSS